MRIYIGPCGLGLGHITRCEKIGRQMIRNGDEILFSSYLDGVDYLQRTGLRYYSAFPISFRTREDGTIDPKLTATQNGVTVGLWKFVKQLVGEIEQIAKFRPDVVVSDTRVSTLLAAVILRRPSCLILNQYSIQMPQHPMTLKKVDRMMMFFARIIWKYASSLLGSFWGLSRVIIVPDLPPPHTISEYNLGIPRRIRKKVRFVGPVNREEPITLSKLARKETPSVFACVSGPAADRRYLVRALTRLLSEVHRDWSVLLSCGEPNQDTSPRQRGKLTIYEWMDELTYDQSFENANVIVCRGGHETIMKAITLGKPLVLIPAPNHTEQSNNARRAEELGVAVVVQQNSLNLESLTEAVEKCMTVPSEKAIELSAIVTAQQGLDAVIGTAYSLAQPEKHGLTAHPRAEGNTMVIENAKA